MSWQLTHVYFDPALSHQHGIDNCHGLGYIIPTGRVYSVDASALLVISRVTKRHMFRRLVPFHHSTQYGLAPFAINDGGAMYEVDIFAGVEAVVVAIAKWQADGTKPKYTYNIVNESCQHPIGCRFNRIHNHQTGRKRMSFFDRTDYLRDGYQN